MSETERLTQLLEQYKNEASTLLAENKVEEAEAKTTEIKILKAKLEVQEKLDEATNSMEQMKNTLSEKDETISNLSTELENVKNEKLEIMNNFSEATEKATNLSEKVAEMQPIVEKYNKEQYDNKLSTAQNAYKTKFENHEALEVYNSEEVQNLIMDSIDEDEAISTKAKYSLSEKILNLIESRDSQTVTVNSINEPTKQSKNLNPEDNEFEAVYGFKKI